MDTTKGAAKTMEDAAKEALDTAAKTEITYSCSTPNCDKEKTLTANVPPPS
ncbi:MAG: hypothetical protein ACYTEZ_16400 [Planctomycetota bacterium]|jgi:hypothetical protein